MNDQPIIQMTGVEKPIAIAMPDYFHTVDHQRGDNVWLGVQPSIKRGYVVSPPTQ